MSSVTNPTYHFFSKDVDDTFQSTVENIFNNRQDSLFSLCLCSVCHGVPDTIEIPLINNQTGWAVTFECNLCKYSWVLCRFCALSDQPASPPRKIRRMTINQRITFINQMVSSHASICHPVGGNNFDSHHFNDVFLNPGITDDSENPERISESDLLNEIRQSQAFNDEDTRLVEGKKSMIPHLLARKYCEGSYASILIKKFWMGNEFCEISESDCDLFLRIVSELITSSRDANRRLMKINELNSFRSDRMMLDLQNRLSMHQKMLNAHRSLHGVLMGYINAITAGDDSLKSSFISLQSGIQELLEQCNLTEHGSSTNATEMNVSNSTEMVSFRRTITLLSCGTLVIVCLHCQSYNRLQ